MPPAAAHFGPAQMACATAEAPAAQHGSGFSFMPTATPAYLRAAHIQRAHFMKQRLYSPLNLLLFACACLLAANLRQASAPANHLAAAAWGALPSSDADGTPPGTILAFAGENVPEGYLLCDGKTVRPHNYPALYAAIGTSWGGVPEVYFYLPDLRGRFLRGADEGQKRDAEASSRTASNTGGNTGDRVGTLQSDEFAEHHHNLTCANGTTGIGSGEYMLLGSKAGGQHNQKSAPYGGTETRPKNASVRFIIKY